MMTKEELRDLVLKAKEKKGLTWEQIGAEVGRNAVGAATIGFGYNTTNADEAAAWVKLLDLPDEARQAFMAPAYRLPAQPWPPTDPFIYRIYEALMLYGPAWKSVAHEVFGDGIISAIDCAFDLEKRVVDGVDRAALTFEGKWLVYKKY